MSPTYRRWKTKCLRRRSCQSGRRRSNGWTPWCRWWCQWSRPGERGSWGLGWRLSGLWTRSHVNRSHRGSAAQVNRGERCDWNSNDPVRSQSTRRETTGRLKKPELWAECRGRFPSCFFESWQKSETITGKHQKNMVLRVKPLWKDHNFSGKNPKYLSWLQRMHISLCSRFAEDKSESV